MKNKNPLKSKKAQANIVVLILIMLLALALIVILWQVVFSFISKEKDAVPKITCITTNFDIKRLDSLNFRIKRTTGGDDFNTADIIVTKDGNTIDNTKYTITQNTLKNQKGTAQVNFTEGFEPKESLEINLILNNQTCQKSKKICFSNAPTGYGYEC